MEADSNGQYWNVVIVSYERQEKKKVLRALKGQGEFQLTSFRSLLIGKVEDVGAFLEEVGKRIPNALSRVIHTRRGNFSCKARGSR